MTITEDNAKQRWAALKAAPQNDKATYNDDKRFGRKSTTQPAGGHPPPADRSRIRDLTPASPDPPIARYGYRSLDRRWVIADNRVMRTPSQPLWAHRSDQQIYLASMLTNVIGEGPAATVTHLIPDYHFFANRGGKDIVPLYRDAEGTPNLPAKLLDEVRPVLGPVSAEELFAYCAALLGHSHYTKTFWEHLETPGPRVPLTAKRELFDRGVALGRKLMGLHTYGARGERPALTGSARLTHPVGPDMPQGFVYDEQAQQLRVGPGVVQPISSEVYGYSVSSFEVVRNWLRGRLRDPVGKARTSKSPLDHIRPNTWSEELDSELLELLWTIEALLHLETSQANLLSEVLGGPTVNAATLSAPTKAEREPPLVGDAAGTLFGWV